jgi:hypothetical protein
MKYIQLVLVTTIFLSLMSSCTKEEELLNTESIEPMMFDVETTPDPPPSEEAGEEGELGPN